MVNLVLMEQGKDIDNPTDDVNRGLYYPLDYAIDTWRNFRDHGVYPEPGGYNDQDYDLMQDWKFINERYNRQAMLNRGDQLEQDPLEVIPKSKRQNARNWKDL